MAIVLLTALLSTASGPVDVVRGRGLLFFAVSLPSLISPLQFAGAYVELPLPRR